jgi:hypothetical protein
MWMLLLVPLSLLGLASCVILGGPRRYGLFSAALALLLLWGWLRLGFWPALAWFLVYGGLRLGLATDYPRRRAATDRGATGRARYLSFLPREDGRRGLVLWLPPLKSPLFWLIGRAKRPLAGTGGMAAGQALLPMLNQIYGESRGFRLDTRHLPGQAGPAMEIRCD